MELIVVGISYKLSSVEIREKLCLQPTEQALLLSALKNEPAVAEAFVLSTCQRTEIYAYTTHDVSEQILQHLFTVKNIPSATSLRKNFYVYTERNAIRHLMQVATGLNSIVLGEKEILGQVKNAVELSRQHNMMGKYLNVLSNVVIRAGKQSRNETAISCGGASTSWAAVAKAEQSLGTLQGKSVLIIGTGKIGSMVAHSLHKKGITSLFIMNRSIEKAEDLARQLNGIAVPFWNIKEILSKVDVCICSSGAPHYLIEKDLVQEVIGQHPRKQIFFIDISVPRNISPEITEIAGARLVTIDELDSVVDENLKKRSEAIAQVKDIIEKKMGIFEEKLKKIIMRETEPDLAVSFSVAREGQHFINN